MERQGLTQIYVDRGLDPLLARQVADQLTAKDALKAHARDELGISDITTARPIQAAITSAITFALGAALPLLALLLALTGNLELTVGAATVLFLALLGYLGAQPGVVNFLPPVRRLGFRGVLFLSACSLHRFVFSACGVLLAPR